jgi:hypothetical protein
MRVLLLLLLITTSVVAQTAPEELFVDARHLPSPVLNALDPGATAIERIAVAMQLERLFGVADDPAARVQLTVGNHRWVGRFERLDHHLSGFRSWVGDIEGIEDSHVVFTERDGVVSGLCPRIPNLSNPNVPYSGLPTGTFGQNNALSITYAAPTVANWRHGENILMPPAAPTGLRSQTVRTLAFGAWDAAANAFSYTLQIGRSPGAADMFNAPLGLVRSVAGMIPPGQYYWRVLASNTAGSSPPSSEAQFSVGACSAPGAPHGLTFSVSGAVVALNWSAPSTGGPVTGYVLEAGSAAGLADLFSGPTGSASPGLVTAAPSGVYFVRVRARNGCGVGGPSNEQVIAVP